MRPFVIAGVIALFALQPFAHASPIEPGAVEVVDGDTIRARGSIYRLVGFDTPESGLDQGGAETLEEIRRRFGEAVAEIVFDCTDTWTKPKPEWLKTGLGASLGL